MSKEQLTEDELNFLDIWYTPKAMLEILFHNWDNLNSFHIKKFGELRLYQEAMLSDESIIDFELTAELNELDKQEIFDCRKRVGDIYCFGARKFGKCEWEENLCTLASGEEQSFKSLVNTVQKVITLNTTTLKLETTKAYFCDNGIKDCFKITLKSGKNITVTENHPFLTSDDWKIVSELKKGDFIATPRIIKTSPLLNVTDEEAKLLGLLLGDGGCTHQVGITNMNQEIIDEIYQLANYFNCDVRNYNISYFFKKPGKFVPHKKNNIQLFVEKYKIGTLSKNKQIPKEVFIWPKEKIALLLNRLYACDGHVSLLNHSIELGLASKKLVEQVSSLLLRFEIPSTIYYRQDKNGFESWRLFICEGFDRFLDEIGIFTKDFGHRRNRQYSTSDRIPNKFIHKFYTFFKNKKLLKLRNLKLYNPSREKCQRLASKIDYEPFTTLAYSDIAWDEIVSIKKVGKLPTVSVKTESNNANYISNNIISHNSLITVICDTIVQMLTNPADKVILGSVDLIHIKRVLDPIKNCFEAHPICKMWKKRIVGAPDYQITLKNDWNLCSVNFNIGSKQPGQNFYGLHGYRLIIEEASLETEEVYEKRKDAVSELGAIYRFSGMTNFIRQSPAGKAFYDPKLKGRVLNLPQACNPTFSEEKQKKLEEEYSGKSSIGFRVFVNGEIVEDGISVFDMQRLREACINEKKKISVIELTKDDFKYYKQLLIVDRPNNAERIFISGDIGLNTTEINILSEVKDNYEYIYNISLHNLTDDEQATIFKHLIELLTANVIAIDCGDGAGRAIFNELEKTIPKSNLVWYDGKEKIPVGFQTNEDGTVIYKDGAPLAKEERMAEWSVKRLKDLFYEGKIVLPEDYKFISQFSQVIAITSGDKILYRCNSPQGDHLFDSFKVFAIAEWLKSDANQTPDINNSWGTGVNG